MQFGFSCIAIFFVPHHIPSICVPVYQPLCISGRRSKVSSLYVRVICLWELNHVALGTIYISCYQIQGHPLDSSIFVSNRCWAIDFVRAFQGIQPQYVCLLKGCVESFLAGLVVFRVRFYGRVCCFDVVAIKVVEFCRYPFYLWGVNSNPKSQQASDCRLTR